MRKITWAVAVMAVVAMPALASADQICWATGTETTRPAGAIPSTFGPTGPGLDLVIVKDDDPGRYEFDIRLMCSNTAPNPNGPQALAGVDLDLFSTRNIQVKSATLNSSLLGGVTVGTGPGRIANLQGLTLLAPPLFGTFELGSIRVSINKTPPPINPNWQIEGIVGANAWGEFPAVGTFNVRFGNGSANGGIGGGSFGDIIVIRNIPEPATLALVGMGVIGLIRRRR